MSCGCIPIVSKIPSSLKVTENGEYGFCFEPGNVNGLMDILARSTRIDRTSFSKKIELYFQQEYSTTSAFNQDNSRLLLQHGSYFGLYDGSPKFLKNLPFEVNASSEPRWSRTAANILYYHAGNQLKQLDVSSNRMSVIHTFTEYSRIDGAGESDICFDGNHLVLAGDRRFIFVFDLKTGKKGGVLDAGKQAFDSLYITPDDHVTVTWIAPGTHSGIELFDNNMNFLRRVAPAGGHMDVTRDTDGEEILLWANAADPMPVCANGIVKIRLSDARQTCLVKFDWTLAIHVSATDNSGWFFVETYAPRDVDTATGWKPYTNEILQVKLDGSELRRIAHHRSRPFNTYNYTPRVSASRDGSRVVFASNFGLPTPAEPPARTTAAGYRNPLYSDVYYIQVAPDTAGTAISGKISSESAALMEPDRPVCVPAKASSLVQIASSCAVVEQSRRSVSGK